MKYKENIPAHDIPNQELAKDILKRRKCTISEEMIKLMLRQLFKELYNHNLYRSFANFYGIQGLNVLEAYFIARAEEEKLHHDWIYKYLADCDAAITYPEIPAISEEFDDNVKPFQLTVDAEIETTEMIYEMVDLAMQEKDWATFNWLNGNDNTYGRLVMEQVEEEAISRTALDIACEEGSWLRKEKSIMDAYKNDVD